MRASRRTDTGEIVPVAILRDGRASKSAVADFDTLRCRSRAGPTSVRGLLRMRSEGLIASVRYDGFHGIDPLDIIATFSEWANRALKRHWVTRPRRSRDACKRLFISIFHWSTRLRDRPAVPAVPFSARAGIGCLLNCASCFLLKQHFHLLGRKPCRQPCLGQKP